MLSVPQLIVEGKYVLFGPEGVAIFRKLKVIGTPIMEGRRRQSVYVLSAESAYVDKTRRNETGDLWHARLGHVNYNKLKEDAETSGERASSNRHPDRHSVCRLSVWQGSSIAIQGVRASIEGTFGALTLRCLWLSQANIYWRNEAHGDFY